MSLNGVCLEEERQADSPQEKEKQLIFCMTYLDNYFPKHLLHNTKAYVKDYAQSKL